MKLFIALLLALMVVSLFSALFFLVKDKGHRSRTKNALAIRVGLSALLLVVLFVAYSMGWISPRGGG